MKIIKTAKYREISIEEWDRLNNERPDIWWDISRYLHQNTGVSIEKAAKDMGVSVDVIEAVAMGASVDNDNGIMNSR